MPESIGDTGAFRSLSEPDRPRRRRPRQAGGARQASPRVEGLDGLRAFAILGVVLYHLGVPFLPSGHMGVVVFLVLTGFLVTSKLVREYARGRRISVASFWGGRLGRLWPATALMVLVTCVLCMCVNHVALTKMRPDVLPSLTFTLNLSFIVRGLSYFDQIGGVSPLTHLWYLGLDAQFCVAWSLVLLLCFSLGVRRDSIRRVAFALALASAVLMAVLYNPDADPSRVYYGFDTRVFAPLLGAWLGIAWPLGQRSPRLPFDPGPALRDLGGLVACAVVVVVMALVPTNSPFFYRGGMFLVAVLCVLLVSAACTQGGLFSALFSAAPLVWLGNRSFALYLWHYPIFTLFGVTTGVAPWWMGLVALAVSLLAAEASYRLFEGGVAGGLLANALEERPGASGLRYAPFALTLALVLVAGVGLAVVPDETLVPEEAITSTGEGAASAMDLTAEGGEPAGAGEEGEDGDGDDGDGDGDEPGQDLAALPTGAITLLAGAEEANAGVRDPVLIGDSVPGACLEYFNAHCPNGLIDSYVGRRPDQMAVVLQGYLEQGVVGHVVVLQAFSNNIPTLTELDAMINACGEGREVYLVTVQIPNAERAQMNANILEAAEKHENAHIIDWYTYSLDNLGEWLYQDLTHLREQYAGVYVDLITNAIAQDFARGGGRVLAEGESAEPGTPEASEVADAGAETVSA